MWTTLNYFVWLLWHLIAKNCIFSRIVDKFGYFLHAALQMSMQESAGEPSSQSDVSKVLEDQSFLSSILESVCVLDPIPLYSTIIMLLFSWYVILLTASRSWPQWSFSERASCISEESVPWKGWRKPIEWGKMKMWRNCCVSLKYGFKFKKYPWSCLFA